MKLKKAEKVKLKNALTKYSRGVDAMKELHLFLAKEQKDISLKDLITNLEANQRRVKLFLEKKYGFKNEK